MNMCPDNPILNSPYEEPKFHYATDLDGSLNYLDIRQGRRIFIPDIQVMPTKQARPATIFEVNDLVAEYGTHLINLCRQEVGKWRSEKYPHTTRVTRELLLFWFENPERHAISKLFFAQREAIETAIWLNEVASKSNAGQNILNRIREAQKTVSDNPEDHLPRIAFKMATGTGKTVVMGCLILYHYFNRQEYKNDVRFADYFLIVTPGITIKDRLGVLFVDTKNKYKREDYYFQRKLVPQNLEHRLENLNARLVITNYHVFEPKTLQGNKKSPFDGKVDTSGKKLEAKEDFSQVIRRVLGKFKKDSRLLIINDEAHHCYLPKSSGRTEDNEETDENARAAVWFTGIKEVAKRYKVSCIYDLSATPYYLKGSGYTPYSLFPWVVTDFGLIEAIESGLVKIPFLPESDNTQEITQAKLRDIYLYVKDELPRKGQRRKKSEAKEEGKTLKEAPPQLPVLVKAALDQFYNHYEDYYEGHRKQLEERPNLFSPPPVFIIVCNNTSVSKEVYKYIAGYEFENEKGELVTVPGHYELFSNYDQKTNKPLRRPPTLLIDSDALENSDQINEDFKKIFASEIEEFKKDYARMYGQGSAERITDAQILREVVNTVGKPGKLGAHIRCVVSVSMLTEGWDANNVTHIMGIRKFGSQLLCEQVAGRALRRMSYYLQGYDSEGNPTNDKRKIVVEKFPPEYAHIIGVPFKMFKGGKSTTLPTPVESTHIYALPERQAAHEITFPNVVGYRIENANDELTYDFSAVENFEIDCSKFPLQTTMASAFLPKEEKLQVQSVFEKRKQEIIFLLTKALINYHFSDDDKNPRFQYFGKLKEIVEYWYINKVVLIGENDEKFKKLLYFFNPKLMADHIRRGINPHINTTEYIRPVFNYYNKFGSTKYVNGNTAKEVYPTQKSHVNFVVADTDSWEQIAAKTLEELPQVKSYVKNNFLGFSIPYVKDGKDKLYFPDFIARVKGKNGTEKNLIIEISGMSQDKAEKKWYVVNRWLPAVNALKDKYGYPEWHFIEIANDIRNIKNQLIEKIASI
ncbi:MAG: DEAD/DEAH box helicase family protein [Flavobacteriales bacterium]|nr:DEAD/DEAH box helicase family protein [Flavobacteriales bacterium]MDW8410940.1 DEAD/DEAH box helicase family protein [Flavobacteriales bacterium]